MGKTPEGEKNEREVTNKRMRSHLSVMATNGTAPARAVVVGLKFGEPLSFHQVAVA